MQDTNTKHKYKQSKHTVLDITLYQGGVSRREIRAGNFSTKKFQTNQYQCTRTIQIQNRITKNPNKEEGEGKEMTSMTFLHSSKEAD